jgi:hypothetical protein
MSIARALHAQFFIRANIAEAVAALGATPSQN